MTVRIEKDGEVALVVIDNPPVNALSQAVRAGLSDAARTLEADPEVRAVVLTGAGGVFCAGGDLKKMLADHRAGAVTGAEDVAPRMKRLHGWLRILRDLPVPVISAVDGPAYGAGLGLALTADIVLASDRARFNASFCKVGAVPDATADDPSAWVAAAGAHLRAEPARVAAETHEPARPSPFSSGLLDGDGHVH